jgi:hypothetical protein
MSQRRRLFRDQKSAVIVGLVLFVAGAIVLHDAYEGRGRATPLILRPFTWW